MTDLERWIELFNDYNIPYRYDNFDAHSEIILSVSPDFDSKESPTVIGYYGFYFNIYFDNNHDFIRVGVYE